MQEFWVAPAETGLHRALQQQLTSLTPTGHLEVNSDHMNHRNLHKRKHCNAAKESLAPRLRRPVGLL